MFRGRTDYSWPLILVLIGLFFLSLRLPRQWERIARPTALVLAPHKSLPAKDLPSAVGSRREVLPLDVFRLIKPASQVGSHADGLASSTSRAKPQTSPTVVMPVVVAKSPGAEIIPAAAPVVEPAKVTVTAKGSIDSQTDKAVLPSPSTSRQPVFLPLQETGNAVASAASEKTDEVRVLRDVPESLPGPDLGPDNAAATGPEVRRLPPPTAEVVQAQPSEQPSGDSDVVHQRFPSTAIPEPSIAVEPSPVMAETPPNPIRAVVPEPQPPAVQNLPSVNAQPALPETNAITIVDGEKPAEVAKPADKAGPTGPQTSESAASKASMATIGPMRAIGRAWEEPTHLLGQLDELKKHDMTQGWASETSATIHKLGPAISVGAAQTAEILQHLEQLAGETPSLLTKISDEALAQNLSGTSQGLERRIAIWKQIGRMGGMDAANVPSPAVDPRSFNKCLNEIDQLTSTSPEGHAWRKYMLIESLHDWAARRRNNDERLPHELAQQVLKRFNQMSYTSHQRQFLTSGPMAALNREMLRHTAGPVESSRLLQHLENYETSSLPSDARLLAQDCQFLSVGSGTPQRELGELFETRYRNANLRIAVTAELLNRMMPKREPEYAPVQDTIQGVPVRGQSLMASEITVRMIPDPQHVRLAVEVNGEVASETHSNAGPATFYSDSESSYIARKPIVISLRGIRMEETQVAVDNNSQLKGVSTKFQKIPFLGQVARSVAESQYNDKAPAANAEVRGKIGAKAKERVDRETTEQITAAAKRLQDEVLGPMDALLLDPTMIAAETTEKRFSMRIRLAGPDQLGGHTSRPQAPSDSLASLQIHESMLNNVLARLELDGQTFDLAGLGQRLAQRLHRYQPKPVDPDQEDVKISFAVKDAVHVRCNDGRLEITLAIARLSKGSRRWKDFQVRAFYRPVVQGRSVDLARDGVVQLIGARMGISAQIALRGVFSKVFSQKEPIHATPESFVKNPKLEGVVVTQFVVNDGWIAAAIGPQRTITVQAATTQR